MNGEKGFFHCFGCGLGGDVIKFVELYDKVGFPEAVRQLAGRAGLTVPEAEDAKQDGESQREREALLKVHEVAAAWFRGAARRRRRARARRRLLARPRHDDRDDRAARHGLRAGVGGLRARLLKEGFAEALLFKSGLLVQREDGQRRAIGFAIG